MKIPLFLLFLISLFSGSEAICGGFAFLGGSTNSTCDRLIPFLQVIKDVVKNYLPNDGNIFGIRRFGSIEHDSYFSPLNYTSNRTAFLVDLEGWIEDYPYNLCFGLTDEGMYYTEPLRDLANHIMSSEYDGYGIFLAGNTDVNTDLHDAAANAKIIAGVPNADVYVWDFSVNSTSDLFDILTGGKKGHILRKPNLNYSELYDFVASAMVPEFSGIACGNQGSSSPAPTTTPSVGSTTPPPTNTSCTSLELIFILDRSTSIVPAVYKTNVTQFVIDFAGQFSFPNEAFPRAGYTRFGVIQYADSAEVSIPLGNYTRSAFDRHVKQKVTVGHGGVNNITAALLAAYDQFQSHSVLSNKAVVLIVEDVPTIFMQDAIHAMTELETLVNFPMGVIVPGFSVTTDEALGHLKTLLRNNSKLAFPDLSTALQSTPDLITSTYPCQLPSACSALIFIEEATDTIGNDSKVSFLELAQKLVDSISVHKDNERFGIALFGGTISHNIELETYTNFNTTVRALIKSIEEDNFPNSGQTYLAPILDQLLDVSKKEAKTNFTVILMAETEAIKDPTKAFASAQKIAATGIDVYVVDKSKGVTPSSLFSTLTNKLPGHILNGTFTDPLHLFPQLSQTALVDFQNMGC